jgi:alpha/beta superfamily hydrolase
MAQKMAQARLTGKAAMEVTFVSGNETLQATLYGDFLTTTSAGVVLCPPHPLHGGNRHDTRLVTIARELSKHGVPALCIDYGSYGGGKGKVQHVLDAVAYMRGKDIRSQGYLGIRLALWLRLMLLQLLRLTVLSPCRF